MTAYRDQYASLFNGGQNVVLIGITFNPAEELHDWLSEADFPFVFATDNGDLGATYARFGGSRRGPGEPSEGNISNRTVIVVGPDGRVAGTILDFNQVDASAYAELERIVDEVTPEADGN